MNRTDHNKILYMIVNAVLAVLKILAGQAAVILAVAAMIFWFVSYYRCWIQKNYFVSVICMILGACILLITLSFVGDRFMYGHGNGLDGRYGGRVPGRRQWLHALHYWEGCRCFICGKRRDKNHEWYRGTCIRCGKKYVYGEHKKEADMKRIPLSTVGKYGILIENQKEYDIAARAVTVNGCPDELFIVGGAKIKEKESIQAEHITAAHARDLCRPYYPFWVADKRTLRLAIEGRLNEITPLSAEIFPSLKCCFRCRQCAYRTVKEKTGIWSSERDAVPESAMMNSEDMQKAVRALSEAGVKEVVFTGGGEPLTNFEVTASGIEQACRAGMGVGLFTNGLLLNKEKADRLLAAGPDFIRISIYGFDRENFSKYTSSPAECYDAVIKNLKYLIARRNGTGSGTKVLLSVLMQPVMIPDVSKWERFTEMFTEEELKSIEGVRITPAINYKTGERQQDLAYFEEFIKYMDAYSEKHDYPRIVIYRHRIRDMYDRKIYGGCSGSRIYAELGPGGKAYYCCEKACDDGNVIGDYRTQPLCGMCSDPGIQRENCDTSACPAVCKPHEFNRFLYYVRELTNAGKEDLILQWAADLEKIKDLERFS